MNQVSRQNAPTDVEKDFYKLMNNSNFGYNCRNNADNCFLQPIYDEIEELSYAKGYQNIFDQMTLSRPKYSNARSKRTFWQSCALSTLRTNITRQGKIPLKFKKKGAWTRCFPWKNHNKKNIKKYHKRSKSETKGWRTMSKDKVYHWIWCGSGLQRKMSCCKKK